MICAVCETETPDTPCAECGEEPLLVGKYKLHRILGQGAQGTTFLAHGPDGQRAIKELHLGRTSPGKEAERIHREAAVLSQIRHPQVPTLYEHFVQGVGVARSLYLVQDYVHGETLEARLSTHRFTEAEVIDLVQQVGRIVSTLHALSPPIIHRDIKPSNLMIDDDGQVHLIDFGSVRDVMADTVGGGSTVAGTFGYMPPEQLVGDATPSSDIYALGMTAVRLLTRVEPTTLKDRTGRLSWRNQANVSDIVADWVDAMVQADPLHRSTADVVSQGPVAGGPAPAPVTAPLTTPSPLPPLAPRPSALSKLFVLVSALFMSVVNRLLRKGKLPSVKTLGKEAIKQWSASDRDTPPRLPRERSDDKRERKKRDKLNKKRRKQAKKKDD